MFQSLRHKIILVAAVCASITLLGFVALYWLTLEQQQSLDRHRDLPAVSLKWFSLNNAVHKASLAQKSWIDSGDLKFIKERDLTWAVDIHPAFKQLDLLYKKVRVWEGERSVERRVFYDLRLMILSLENLQKKHKRSGTKTYSGRSTDYLDRQGVAFGTEHQQSGGNNDSLANRFCSSAGI